MTYKHVSLSAGRHSCWCAFRTADRGFKSHSRQATSKGPQPQTPHVESTSYEELDLTRSTPTGHDRLAAQKG